MMIFRLMRGPLSSLLMAETGALMDTGYNVIIGLKWLINTSQLFTQAGPQRILESYAGSEDRRVQGNDRTGR